uniref:Helitron_like_N domain-containing protein n=1 Tax=Heligmosomoides polygyrus TaxID=6339 RepID=A0A183GJT5_HELPZ
MLLILNGSDDRAGDASRGRNAGPHRIVPQTATGLARSPRERPSSNTLGNMDQRLWGISEKTTPNSTVYNMCCNLGKVSVNVCENFSVLLQQLYTATGSESIQFLKHIQNYNNSLAMASTTAQLENSSGGGPYCFRVHGQIYHRIGALRPLAGNPPQCAQVLIMDTEEAAAELAGRDVNRECDRATFAVLYQLLQTVDPYVQAYQLMDEVAREEEQRAVEAQRTQRPVRMVFCQLNTDDHRRYNIATANELAVVHVGNDEKIPGERYVVVYERGQGLRTISYLYMLCDPLSYPLLFPRGEDGCHPDMEKTVTGNNRRTRVTQKELYSYLLFARTGTFNPLLHAGKLSQQYVVDSWLKIKMSRLNYLRKNQELRLDMVRGLYDYMIGDDTHYGPPGRRIILAASFTGGPRHMIAQYQDAMSTASKYGKPDIFLIFTCNPNWRKIQNNLTGGESASDRPDLVTRAFNFKLKALCHEFFKRNVLGEVAAYIYLISVELPDPGSDPELFDIVSKNMIHHPCGNLNPTSPYMRDGECTKRLPKNFHSETLNVDGSPEYRRRDDAR